MRRLPLLALTLAALALPQCNGSPSDGGGGGSDNVVVGFVGTSWAVDFQGKTYTGDRFQIKLSPGKYEMSGTYTDAFGAFFTQWPGGSGGVQLGSIRSISGRQFGLVGCEIEYGPSSPPGSRFRFEFTVTNDNTKICG